VVEHSFVAVLQHWSARQSADERHPATHSFLLQSGVPASSSQSEFSQQVPLTQLPLQHFWSPPHCASVVHAQFSVPHCCVTVLQHWSARQLADERQPATHSFFLQIGLPPSPLQSEFSQHSPETQLPPQHFLSVPHCASVVHAQFSVPHVFVARSQH
jgi:hypothetical protein